MEEEMEERGEGLEKNKNKKHILKIGMDEVEDEEGLSRKARYCMKHDLKGGRYDDKEEYG